MVEVTLNISPLEQGTITEDGVNQSSTAHVRIKADEYVANDKNFFKGIFDITAAIPEEWEGSPDGDNILRIPSCPSGPTWDDANYKIVYYHYYISRSTYTSSAGDHLWRVGYIALHIPQLWANKSSELPFIEAYQDVAYQQGWQSKHSAYYTNINIQENSITYIEDNVERTTTLAQFCLGTLLHFDPTTDSFSSNEKGIRDSSEKACDVALLGYTSLNILKYSKRWVLADDSDIVNFSDGLAIDKWRFVLKVGNVDTLKTTQIINAHRKFKLQMDSWEMTQSNILINSGMCDDISGDIFTYPFPASFWLLDNSDDLEMFMLPESISGDIFTYPYPASLWWLNDENILKLMFLPEALELPPEGGAFLNARSLEFVKIPKSVTSIGYESFQGTKLKAVLLSRKCTYHSTSFPQGCKIYFYEDLYDQNYQILVAGRNSYRFTETITHDEESEMCEIP